MKKYSSEYFEKKYKILFNRLTIRDGFIDEIKKTRKDLGIPIDDGFSNVQDLAKYLMDSLNKENKMSLTMASFLEQYRTVNSIDSKIPDKDKSLDDFFKKYKTGISPIAIMFFLLKRIDDHGVFFTKNDFLPKFYNKMFSKIFTKELLLFNKFYGIDLLDDHIIMQYIEKYLFLGKNGIDNFIKSRINCSECKYIGIKEFSPNRLNMMGVDKGPFHDEYIFNEETIKRISRDFDSAFLIIKPYATKEEVLQYVEDNWSYIKGDLIEKNAYYRQLDIHPSKIKESDLEKNRAVYELYKLSKKELIKRYKGDRNFSLPGIYKETIISVILKEEHDIDMSSDAIKKSAMRFKKDTKKREIKDIRDI